MNTHVDTHIYLFAIFISKCFILAHCSFAESYIQSCKQGFMQILNQEDWGKSCLWKLNPLSSKCAVIASTCKLKAETCC